MKFLGSPLDIPAGVSSTHAVRKSYVDSADTLLGDRLTTLEGKPSGLTTVTRTTATTAAAGQLVLANATAAGFTVTLPAAAPVNTIVGVKKVDNTTNLVTVVGSGTDVIDGDVSVFLPTPQTAAQFVYDGTMWRVTAVVVYDTSTIPTLTYKGTYNPATGYVLNDVVYYLGSSYVALGATTGNAPTMDASDARWGLLALHGDSGTSGNNGAVFSRILTKTAAFTTLAGDYILGDAAGGAFTVTLPGNPPVGTLVGVKKVDASTNDLSVIGANGATIDGDASCVLRGAYTGVTFLYEGTNWLIQSTTFLG